MLLALSLALVSGSFAMQHQAPPEPTVRPASNPQFAGTYHPAYGFRPDKNQDRSGPTLIFNNMQHFAYYSIPGIDQEWIDEGKFLDRNSEHTEQINGFSFSYCTSEIAPNGLSNTYRFYDETNLCSGPSSWPTSDCSYALAGLPASWGGGLACWTVAVDLTGMECDLTTDPAQQRYFGYSGTWDQGQTGPWLALGGHGKDDSFVWFDTSAPNHNSAFLGCYWGDQGLFNLALSLSGPPSETRAINARQPGSADSLALCVNSEVQNGNTVQFGVRDRESNALLASKLWVSANQYDHHLLFGTFALDAHLLSGYVDRVPSIGTQSSSSGIFTFTLAGIPSGVYFTQAATVDPQGRPIALSNALRHTVF